MYEFDWNSKEFREIESHVLFSVQSWSVCWSNKNENKFTFRCTRSTLSIQFFISEYRLFHIIVKFLRIRNMVNTFSIKQNTYYPNWILDKLKSKSVNNQSKSITEKVNAIYSTSKNKTLWVRCAHHQDNLNGIYQSKST